MFSYTHESDGDYDKKLVEMAMEFKSAKEAIDWAWKTYPDFFEDYAQVIQVYVSTAEACTAHELIGMPTDTDISFVMTVVNNVKASRPDAISA